MLFGDKLQEARKVAKMSQKQLSLATGITQQTISKYEQNKVKPGYDHMLLLIEHLDIEPGHFFGKMSEINEKAQILRWLKSQEGLLIAQNTSESWSAAGRLRWFIKQIEQGEHLK